VVPDITTQKVIRTEVGVPGTFDTAGDYNLEIPLGIGFVGPNIDYDAQVVAK
jgi:hypothetical protein